MRTLPAPPSELLADLYLRQRLTTRQIGEQLNTNKTQVIRWLRRAGIDRRAPTRGLANRGITGPTAEELYRFIHIEHRSYAEVASLYGVHERAVHGWLDKAGVPRAEIWTTRRKRRVQMPSRPELIRLYESGQSAEVIGDRFGVGYGAIVRRLREYGIQVRPGGFGGRRFTCDDGHVVLSSYERRVDNWLHERGIVHEYEPHLPFGRNMRGDFLANGWYIEVWGVTNRQDYAERKARKRRLYWSHDLPLVDISPWDFSAKAKDLWKRKLTAVLSAPVQRELLLIA